MNIQRVVVVFLAMALAAAASAQFTPMQPGEVIVTCFSDNNNAGPVMAKMDVRNPGPRGAPIGQNWFEPAMLAEHPADWTRGKLGGEVFGIALDDAPSPNIYVTTTIIYVGNGGIAQTAPGSGKVYKFKGIDGTLEKTATLPNDTSAGVNGQGLGNIAYDPVHKQLFVTNFYDGKIYRLDTDLNPIGTAFDPFAVFDVTTNTSARKVVKLGERIWGVGVYKNEVYFGVWSSDAVPGTANTVWSVALDGNGNFTSTVKNRLTIPPNPSGKTMPVADIEFSPKGQMFLAERGMTSSVTNVPIYTIAHQARVLEYTEVAGTWTPTTGKVFNVGVLGNPAHNASGGVAYSCPAREDGAGTVIATGDALRLGPQYIYGLQLFPDTAGTHTINDSYLIDVDTLVAQVNNNIPYDKTQIGDVDVYNTCGKACANVVPAEVLCTTDGTGDYIIKLKITNLTPDTIHHAVITGLPAGVTANPSLINLTSTPILPGATVTTPPIRIHGAAAGALSFTLSIHNIDFEECCSTRITIPLPECDCAQITSSTGPYCNWFKPGRYNYTFTLQNLFPGAVSYVLITPEAPSTAVVSPNVIDLTATPIAQNGSKSLTIAIQNAAPGSKVCLRISTHNTNFAECCSILVCVTIPRCWDYTGGVIENEFTRLTEVGTFLQLDSPQGEPGCTLPLAPDVKRVDVEWLPIDASLAAGAYLEQRIRGTVDNVAGTIAASRTERVGGASELRTSFPALSPTRYRYEFLRAGELIGVQFDVPSDVPAILNGGTRIPTRDGHFVVRGFVPASVENPASCEGPGAGCLFAGYTFKTLNDFAIPGSSVTYSADEVRVYPLDAKTSAIRTSALDIRGHGFTRLTLTSVTVAFDCNNNGIDDADDIAGGVSDDLNQDAIPDECQRATGGITVNLNTGYDQVSGSLLPFGTLPAGTNDDDWRIVAPGAERPAKVVINPVSGWAAALPSSRWISVDPNQGASIPGVSLLAFQRCFCLAGDARDVTLDLRLRADNEATVLLNGQKLEGPGGAHNAATPMTVRRTGAAGDGLFLAGQNCIKVEVTDGGFYGGLDLIGTVTGTGSSCTPP